ncbi:hypothetical protein GVN20_12755 [Runella sp. CRIBMP]|uniref:HNH endonuclease domain-containing protein n=1 Tax=Runella sp. CRIBMP TaxID=2683261 RepID=UPI001413657D|nr:HNH endonuclease domain-containing protein [Runella sp. CRIBMP]NBB20226.1 hypothetical protein [Runella sp. CRIBMP]
MNYEIFKNINKIIERDSKTTTYKFALLRGTIDIIQENSPFINSKDDKIYIPLWLLVEKWLVYYYPIFEANISFAQIQGNVQLAFERPFKELTDRYQPYGGFSAFYNDLKYKGIPQDIQPVFVELIKKLRNTIVTMPMRYIGRSISNEEYSIYKFNLVKASLRSVKIDKEYLIQSFGSFWISKEYYEAFKLLGSFITGQDSLLVKWAEFSVSASNKLLSTQMVLQEVLKSPVTERDVKESKVKYKELLKSEGAVFCVWTGDKISNYDIDHVIPFSVLKNNDLWNLLPAKPSINNLKRDKLPSVNLIERQKNLILYYWELLHNTNPTRFDKEIKISLLGDSSFENWQTDAIQQLQKTCDYLTTIRGFEEWNIKN